MSVTVFFIGYGIILGIVIYKAVKSYKNFNKKYLGK